jgi:dienelactone hydrolase
MITPRAFAPHPPPSDIIALVRRRRLAIAVVVVFVLVAGLVARPYVRGAVFVVQAAGLGGVARTLARRDLQDVTVGSAFEIPWRSGRLRARAYRPAHWHGARGILMVPGIHGSGIDETRFVGFAHDIASTGHPVLTVELPDLKQYTITTRTTDQIEDAAAWTLGRDDLRGRDGRIGMLGISFGGGLTIVAAGRSSIAGRVAFAMAFGGYGDLPRVLRYLCTGIQPGGAYRAPHDYGLAIVTLGVADRLVPADQVQPLRTAILMFLDASRLDLIDKAESAAEFARAQQLEAQLPEPSRTYMDYVNRRDVARLGPVLLPHLGALSGDPSLSPDRSPLPHSVVYLLHGTDDNVVPAIESTLLAATLRGHGTPVHLLLTPLITHAEVDRASTAHAVWNLIRFWADLLNE